jgi:CO/xanthine dehydrogenase FAD-binding subunit
MLRKIQEFEYFNPSTMSEALSLLRKYNGQAKILAGGTDLLVGMKEKGLSPRYIIDIKGIPGLKSIHFNTDQGLTIGALATMQEVEVFPTIREHYSFLSYSAGEVGSVQVRNRATIGGNLCNAAPSAETATPLLCLDARVKIASSKGERIISLEDFFKGPGFTVLDRKGLAEELAEDYKGLAEILTQILVPPSKKKGIYIKHSPRRAMDIAVVGVAAAVTESKDGTWSDVRIALGAVAPVPLRAKKAEEELRGKKPTMDSIQKAARLAQKAVFPISDVRASAEYRLEMVEALVKKALFRLSGISSEA